MTDETISEAPFICDKCGKPVLDGQAVYSCTYDEEKRLARHAECHDWRPASEIFKEFDEKLAAAKTALAQLNTRLRR